MAASRCGQKGQAIVLIALMLGVVVGMAALAIDGSRAYALRRDLQAAADAAAIAAGDNFQRNGSYVSAEQAATTSFSVNMRLYSAPTCSPGYGSPGSGPFTVTCTYGDSTKLVQVVSTLGAAGTQFAMTASRPLALQFARILTNGSTPTVSSVSAASVGNRLYAPTVAALGQNGCGGTSGSAISVAGSGTLSVSGDVISNGVISVSAGSMDVNGDVYARCQSSVSGSSNDCYPSGNSPPCTYPDVAGAVRTGYHYADPNYPPPPLNGTGQASPGSNVVLQPGTYSSLPFLFGSRCYFLAAGVYNWQNGFINLGDFVSNELKPPDEPLSTNNAVRSPNQFWNSDNSNCSGAVSLNVTSGPRGIPVGFWSFVVTSTRTDTFNGSSFPRESAPSTCNTVHINNSGQSIQLSVSNVPGATGYNIYASPSGSCNGPFGLADSFPVVGTVSNSNTSTCPSFSGSSCSLGHESFTLDLTDLGPPFAPSSIVGAGLPGSYPPNPETAPLLPSLPNQNPPTAAGASGDRANENNCESLSGVYASCPGPVTPGAVVFYFPSPSCLINILAGDDYYFSGYQYNWMAFYEPGAGSPPANTCGAILGSNLNSALIGLLYAPAAPITVSGPYAFESPAMGGIISNTISFTGVLPTLNFSPAYAPWPFASRIIS